MGVRAWTWEMQPGMMLQSMVHVGGAVMMSNTDYLQVNGLSNKKVLAGSHLPCSSPSLFFVHQAH